VVPRGKKPVDLAILWESELPFEKNNGQNRLTLIRSSSNRGFSAGNNMGIRYALLDEQCAFVWLLNNDTVVPHSTLGNFVSHHNFVSERSKLGILGCRLLFYHSPHVQQAYAGKFNKWTCVTSHIGENEQVTGLIQRKMGECDYPIGASLFVPTGFIKEVGLLDEAYFLYFEELDWTERGKKKGWISGIDDTSFIYHKHGVSTGNSSTLNRSLFSEKVILASKVLFLKKHYPYLLLSMIVTFPIVLLNRIKRGQYKRVPILIGYFATCLFNQVIRPQSLQKSV
jgi:GT2 family glycosyltransferase